MKYEYVKPAMCAKKIIHHNLVEFIPGMQVGWISNTQSLNLIHHHNKFKKNT